MHHLLIQQENSNIQNMHFEVQEVPYQEALDKQNEILTQMKYQMSCEEEQLQESANSKDRILGRFLKK